MRELIAAMTNGAVGLPSTRSQPGPRASLAALRGPPAGSRPCGSPRRRRVALSFAAASMTPSRLAMVPPDSLPLDSPNNAVTACAGARDQLVLQVQRAEVARDRVEAAAVHDARAGALGIAMIAIDRAADERRLAGEIAVVRAGARARVDERLAVERVRTDGRAHD